MCGDNPKVEHYGYTVDLLGRVDHLDEAHRLVLEIPIEGVGLNLRIKIQTEEKFTELVDKIRQLQGNFNFCFFSKTCSNFFF